MAHSNQDTSTDLSRQRKWPRRLAILLVGLGLFVYFLPSLVVLGPIRPRLVNWALADLNGQAHVESISVGWFSPIQIRGIELMDAEGQTIAKIPRVTTSKRLIDFLRSDNLGRIDIVNPTLNLELTKDGSNLESILATYLQTTTTDSSRSLPQLELSITDGTLLLAPQQGGAVHQFDAIQAKVKIGSNESPIQCLVSLQTPVTDSDVGKLSIDCVVDPGKSDLTVSTINAKLESNQFPLTSIAPLADRFSDPIQLQGHVTGDLTVFVDRLNSQISLNTKRLNVQDINLLAPAYLGSDRISIQRIAASGRLGLSPQRVTAEQFSVESEIGKLKVDGEFDISQMIKLAVNGQLPSSPFEMDVEADLARILQMLPETMRIRNDVQVTSGTATIHANTRNQSDVQRIMFNMDVANVRAQQGTQSMIWNRPLRVTGAASENNGKVVVENLSIDSDFFELVGKASLAEGNFTFRGDLAQLKQQLGNLMDLSQYEVAGQIGGRLSWTEKPGEPPVGQWAPVQFEGNFVVERPVISAPGFRRWTEQKMQVELNGKIQPHSNGATTVDSGHLGLLVGGEVMSADLLQPLSLQGVNYIQSLDGLQATCTTTGSLDRWLDHLRNLFDLPQFELAGGLNAKYDLNMADSVLRISELTVTANQFSFEGYGAKIQEPQVVGSGDVEIQLDTGDILVHSASLSSSAVALTTNQLAIGLADGFQLTGPIAYQADLQRASNWFGLCRPEDEIAWSGIASGQFDFTEKNKAIGGAVSSTITQLAISQLPDQTGPQTDSLPTNPIANARSGMGRSILWEEEEVFISANLFVDDHFKSLWFGNLKFDSKLVNVRGNGRVDELGSRMVTNINGKWNIRWDTVNRLTQSPLGQLVTIRGSSWQEFALSGPLLPPGNGTAAWVDPQLKAQTSIAWNQANVLEIPIKPSQLTLTLSDSVVQLISDSPGIIGNIASLSPALDLRTANPILTLQPGTIINDLKLTQQHTRQWLKFATPILADATAADGIIGLSTQGAQIPILKPEQTLARGEVRLKDLTIGPGPLSHQLMPLLDQVLLLIKPSIADQSLKKKWMTMDEQVVNYAVQDGRVYHDHLKFKYKGVNVETSGSVGFDQTLDIVASIRILDHWVQKEPLLGGLRGQSIKIPISGTLAHPHLNRHAIASLSREFLERTAKSALTNVINGQLEDAGETLGGKVTDEFDKLQGKFNRILQEDVGGKLEDGWRNGLDRLFNGGKNK